MFQPSSAGAQVAVKRKRQGQLFQPWSALAIDNVTFVTWPAQETARGQSQDSFTRHMMLSLSSGLRMGVIIRPRETLLFFTISRGDTISTGGRYMRV